VKYIKISCNNPRNNENKVRDLHFICFIGKRSNKLQDDQVARERENTG
jgi:hypothetical protein